MIDSKKEEMMSNLKENLAYMKIIQEDQASLKYRLDHLALEETKQRDALEKTVISHVTGLQSEVRD